MADNIVLNKVTTTPPGDTSRFLDRGGVKTQIILIDGGGAASESIVGPTNGLPVVTVRKATVTTRLFINTTATNRVIITPGAPWVLTSITVSSSNASSDNTSILIGIDPTTTPTTSQVVFAHSGFPAGFIHTIGGGGGDIGEGGGTDQLLVTTGTITTDVLNIIATYYLK